MAARRIGSGAVERTIRSHAIGAVLDDVARDYCRKLLAESPSVTAAAKLAGFSARGFQLMRKRLGVRKDE